MVKTGTSGTGTGGRRNWLESNRTVGFLRFPPGQPLACLLKGEPMVLKRPRVRSRTEQPRASSTYSHPYVSEEHAFRTLSNTTRWGGWAAFAGLDTRRLSNRSAPFFDFLGFSSCFHFLSKPGPAEPEPEQIQILDNPQKSKKSENPSKIKK